MTYSEVAARNAETIAIIEQYYENGEPIVLLSPDEYDNLKKAALVFQIEHGHSKMEIRDDLS